MTTDKLVTHRDLDIIERIAQGVPMAAMHPDDRSRAQNLYTRLKNAAEADKPPLLEPPFSRGTVAVSGSGLEWVRVHPGGKAWVNGYGNWAAWEDIGAVSIKRPNPYVTTEQLRRLADDPEQVLWYNTGVDCDSAYSRLTRAFSFAGIKVRTTR
jgi:hypothetical protein